MYEPYKKHLSMLHRMGKYRRLAEAGQGDQKNYLDFSSNDYLGLSHHPAVLAASILAIKEQGAGASGSRLLSGNSSLLETLEAKIAKDKNSQAALVFSTGFQTNISTLSALLDQTVLGAKPIVFFDKLNHSSLYQAIFLSSPELVRYNHNDMQQLAYLLHQYKEDPRPKFIVTETVFGMDGDILPLEKIILLAKRHKAFLYLDEAHATGLLGEHGYGLSTTVDLAELPHLVMGTFSKALGGSGGYIACDQMLREYIINKASGFIYSTAPSPAVIGAASQAWDMVRTLGQQRKKLFSLATLLTEKLLQAGFNTGNSTTHIIPVILRSAHEVMQAKDKLFENRIIVSAIRPPTVPPNAMRLRIALTTSHQQQDIDQLVHTLTRLA